MIVNLSNQLFDHPRKLYNEWGINDEDWKKIMYKFLILEYRQSELHEYIRVIMHKDIPSYTMSRILIRDAIHRLAQDLLNRGVKEIHIQHFHPYEAFIKQYID